MRSFLKFKKHIGQLDIMPSVKKITLQVYQQGNMLILFDENEKSKTVYDIFTRSNKYLKYNNLFDWENIDYMIELRLWKKPTPDQWLLIKDLTKRGVNVRFVRKPDTKKGDQEI